MTYTGVAKPVLNKWTLMQGLLEGLNHTNLRSGHIIKVLLIALSSVAFTACDLVDPKTEPAPSTGNPGELVNLSTNFESDPSSYNQRISTSTRYRQPCELVTGDPSTTADDVVNCLQTNILSYNYDASDRLASSVETDLANNETYRRYFMYADSRPNAQLDKVAQGRGDSLATNYYELHDYSYDSEEGGSTNKLYAEYICDITAADDAEAEAATCNRLNALEVFYYIYNANGYLLRKEWDSDNDSITEHQQIFSYIADPNNSGDFLLSYVQDDDFYNGVIDKDQVLTYTDGILTTRELDFDLTIADIDSIINYDRQDADPGAIFSGQITKECYQMTPRSDSDYACSELSGDPADDELRGHAFFWEHVWEDEDCWVGQLNEIDPENRASEFLCR